MLDYQLLFSSASASLPMGPGTDYLIEEIEGFGLPDVRAVDTPRPRATGEFFAQDYLGGRTITITLTIRGANPTALVANIDALMAAWQPISSDPTATDQLFFQFPGGTARYFVGRPRKAAVTTKRIVGNNAPVVLEFQCADPRQYGIAQTVSLGIFQTASGRTYPRTYPLAYGTAVSDVATVTNSGNFPSRPLARIVGPVTNPRVENITAGKALKFLLVLAATDFLDIDFDARTVVLNGTTSRRSALTFDSTWWEIATGVSQIRFTADTFNAGSAFSLSFTSAWL